MVSKAAVAIKTVLSLAFGGACGALFNFLTSAGADTTKIDWHRLGLTALMGAAIMVFGHYMPPPTAPKQ